MPLSRGEAEQALQEISGTERASATTYGYRTASPHLLLWGVIWMVGYGLTYVRPEWSIVWPILTVAGIAMSTWLGWIDRHSAAPVDRRYRATLLVAFLFTVAMFAVLSPSSPAQISAFIPMLVSLFYCLAGIWMRGVRLLMTGIVVAALTLIGYFWLPNIFPLWMAVVGGGALLLGGVWLRSP
jgi:hypothetical protein